MQRHTIGRTPWRLRELYKNVGYDSYLLVGELQIDSKLVQGLQAFRNTAVLCASASHSGR